MEVSVSNDDGKATVLVSNEDRKAAVRLLEDLHSIHRMYYSYTKRFAPVSEMEAFLFDHKSWPSGTTTRIDRECLNYDASLTDVHIPALKHICRRIFTMKLSDYQPYDQTMIQNFIACRWKSAVIDAMFELAPEFPQFIDFDRVDRDGYSLLWRAVDQANPNWVRICASKCSSHTLCAPVISNNNQLKGQPLVQVVAAAWRDGNQLQLQVTDELLAHAHDDGSRFNLLEFNYVENAARAAVYDRTELIGAIRDKIKVKTERQMRYRIKHLCQTFESFVSLGAFPSVLAELMMQYVFLFLL